MNKTPFDQPSNSEDELLPEYQLDYKKAKPNRFANQSGKKKLTAERQSILDKRQLE